MELSLDLLNEAWHCESCDSECTPSDYGLCHECQSREDSDLLKAEVYAELLEAMNE